MDAFYASVELLRYPQLKGLPVVIGGGRRNADDALLAQFADVPLHEIPVSAFPRISGYEGRGVITTATYAARQFGVGSAMGLMKAARLCPDAILLPVDFAEYRRYSQQFKAIITEIAPVMENRGVDEVYIDFTEVPGGQRQGGRVLARLIQKSIFEATGLTCSVGVAPNTVGQDGQRVQQTQRHFHRARRRFAEPDLALALPQNQWHWPQSRGQTGATRHSHHWRIGTA